MRPSGARARGTAAGAASWAFMGVMALGCGGEVRETPPPLCTLARPDTDEARRREPDNAELLRLMLGPDARLEARGPQTECSGTTITATRSECDPEAASLPAITVTDEEVLTRRVSDVQQLVWIITRSDGVEGEGPVALVERRERGLVVKAQGILRADRGRPRLRLASEGRALVVDSERCSDPNDPATCQRTAQILVKNGNRFERVPVRHRETGRCLTPPAIALTRSETRTLPNGWERTFSLAASWEDASGAIVVHESVSVRDRDPRAPAVPTRPFREVSSERRITLGNGLSGEERPLLDRTLLELGSVEAPRESERSGTEGS